MLKKIVLHSKRLLRNFYAQSLCPQECLFCNNETGSGVPLCSDCIKTEIDERFMFRLQNPTQFCCNCGRFLISENEYCTLCRMQILSENGTELNSGFPQNQFKHSSGCNKVFSIFSYQGLGVKILPRWKNRSERVFAEVFAQSAARFIAVTKELKNTPLVPVPPRPKKLKTKGWDQIEDMAIQLEQFFGVKVLRCLKRLDGAAQKSLSKEGRKTNLQGKILLKKNTRVLPEILVLFDDVMTTGATLSLCAEVLKDAGCKTVYGLCLFFD